MTETDLNNTIDFLKSCNIINEINTVCILSPRSELSEYQKIFKNLTMLSINDWDLNNSYSKNFDLIIAHNIFYMSRTPNIWIDNVMNSCKYFLLQDILKRQRDIEGEFCKTEEDHTRFCFNNHQYFFNNDFIFNLSTINYKIINGIIYNGEKNEYDNNPKHFACLIQKK